MRSESTGQHPSLLAVYHEILVVVTSTQVFTLHSWHQHRNAKKHNLKENMFKFTSVFMYEMSVFV